MKHLNQIASAATLGVLFLAGGVVLSGCAGGSQVRNTSRTFKTVVVDAGHGGKDPGARRQGVSEKDAALDVAQRVNRKLRESQFRTVMTRSSDVFIPLDERVEIQNAQPNSVSVSIHFNHSGSRRLRGAETYYSSPHARSLALRIQQKLSEIPGTRDRGIHTARFRVLRNARYPAVLVECGYLSNRAEVRAAASPAHRERLADKIAEAIVEERYGTGVYAAASRARQLAATPFHNPVPEASDTRRP